MEPRLGKEWFGAGAYSLVLEEQAIVADVCKVCFGRSELYKGDGSGGRATSDVELVYQSTSYKTGNIAVSSPFR